MGLTSTRQCGEACTKMRKRRVKRVAQHIIVGLEDLLRGEATNSAMQTSTPHPSKPQAPRNEVEVFPLLQLRRPTHCLGPRH